MGAAERMTVPLRDIRPSGQNPRRDFGDIGALAETIRATGGEPVNPPVLVRDGNVFRIVDGERRYRALVKIYGKDSDRGVAALVYDALDDANEAVAMMATDDKRQLAEEERARGVQQMLLLGVDAERVAAASRATRGQVAAARMMAPLVPVGAQVTLDQMLAASELPEGDAERVLGARDWRWVLSDIKERDRKAKRSAQVRAALERAGVAVADAPADGMVLAKTVYDYSGVKISDITSAARRLPEGGAAVPVAHGVELWVPEGAALAPVPGEGGAEADAERERLIAAADDLRGRAVRFALCGDWGYAPEVADAARARRTPLDYWDQRLAEEFGLGGELEERAGADAAGGWEMRRALLAAARDVEAPRSSQGEALRRWAEKALDAVSLLAAAGLDTSSEVDRRLVRELVSIADGE